MYWSVFYHWTSRKKEQAFHKAQKLGTEQLQTTDAKIFIDSISY